MYKIILTKKADKALFKLEKSITIKIADKIKMLAQNPYSASNVKKLKGSNSFYRLRVGDYRVIYDIHHNILVIHIIDVGHRREIYD